MHRLLQMGNTKQAANVQAAALTVVPHQADQRAVASPSIQYIMKRKSCNYLQSDPTPPGYVASHGRLQQQVYSLRHFPSRQMRQVQARMRLHTCGANLQPQHDCLG